MTELKYWQAINQALAEEMERDPDVVILGEDVGEAGGPFGATSRLQERFGPWRVRDTPISEATLVGSALGASMTGLRPVVEVMFFDFIAMAMDQIVNQAAKASYMSAGRYSAPMVVRTLSGAGRSTGPQHSQNLEAWLAHVPGLKVVWGATPADARGLLKSAIRDDDPVIVVESLSLWSTRGEVPDDEGLVPIGVASTARSGGDVTIVTWGGAVPRCIAAADSLSGSVDVEVIDLRTISPIDRESILSSVTRTGRLVIVHDAPEAFGGGAEIAAMVSAEAWDCLKGPIIRVAAPFAPTPFPPHMEQAYFPQEQRIADAVIDLMRRTT